MSEEKYPISEIFTSPQGEGLYSGQLMTFVRFAGCNVGKPIKGEEKNSTYNNEIVEELKDTKTYGIIPIWQEECTTFDGRKFLCDTDFRVKERLTAHEILSRVPEGVFHLCFTGGEPLLHAKAIDYIIDLWSEEINYLPKDGKIFHIETSGTIIFDYTERSSIWITVSPKANFKKEMIQRANEVKFLVDKDFPEDEANRIASFDTDGDTIFWLSPINEIASLSKENTDKCLEIQNRHPHWRITNQSHKIWGVK
jgi:organic radical activating enzyme